MSSQDEQDVAPPWGYLVAEQYLILRSPASQRNWDSASRTPPDQQRRNLIRAFLALDHTPEEWTPADKSIPRPPTAAEITNILLPWRPLALRRAAHRIAHVYDPELIILRTHYSADDGSSEKMREWLEIDEEEDEFFDEENLWWRILDDPALFNVGENWERALDVLPELAGRTGSERCKKGVGTADLFDARGPGGTEEGIQELVVSGPAPLLIADEEAFRGGKLRVLFLDSHGNIIRHSRIEPEGMAELKQSAMIYRLQSSKWWEYGEVGEKYTPDGEIGRFLYIPSHDG